MNKPLYYAKLVLKKRQLFKEFEKWCAVCASVGGVGGVLAWVAWVACLCGWRACVGGVGGVGGVLTWVACYYCYCYYWNTTLKKKMFSLNFTKMNKCSKLIWTVIWKKNLAWKAGISLHYFEPISIPMWTNMPRYM